MGRLTVRLPGSLHEHLAILAKREGVSLNQYIVYALTRQVSLAYTVEPVPTRRATQQRESFTALLQGLGTASFDQIQSVMEKREVVKPEAGLTPEVTRILRERLEEKYEAE